MAPAALALVQKTRTAPADLFLCRREEDVRDPRGPGCTSVTAKGEADRPPARHVMNNTADVAGDIAAVPEAAATQSSQE